MVTAYQKAKLIQLKGLDFEISEIAEKLQLRPGQLRYWGRKIEKEAREQGEDEVFVRVMVDGVTPEILRFMRLAQGFRG